MKFNNPIDKKKAVLLAGLYTSQGLGLAFVTTTMPVILRQSGAGLDTISLIFVLGLIWSVKFLWAPLVDRYGSARHGHYRGWILIAQLLLIIVTLVISCFSVTSDLVLLSFLFFLLTVFSATQDVATDGLAVTILKPGERAAGNSIQSAGNMIGFMIAGGLILTVYDQLGWRGSLLVLAGGMALPLISIMNYREQPVPANRATNGINYKLLVDFFRKPGILRWIPVLLLFRVNFQITYWLLSPILVDFGWSLDRIGVVLNIFGLMLGVAGAALSGYLVGLLGRKSTMLTAMILGMLGTLSLAGLLQRIEATIPVIVFLVLGLIMIAWGFSSTVMYTVIMDKCDPASAATDFSLQWSLTGIAAMVGGGVAMAMAEYIGYTGVLIISVGTAAVSSVLTWSYDGFKSERIKTAQLN